MFHSPGQTTNRKLFTSFCGTVIFLLTIITITLLEDKKYRQLLKKKAKDWKREYYDQL